MDPRTPVLVGAAQLTHRPADGTPPPPSALTAAAVRAAAQDAGIGEQQVLDRLDAIAIVDPFSWPVPDPGRLVADELGLPETTRTLKSAIGGTGPVVLLGTLASRIAAGDLDVAVLAGGEVGTAFFRASRTGEDLGWPTQPEGTAVPETIGETDGPSHPLELASGMLAPLMYYPVFDHALRGAEGRSAEDQHARNSAIWARYAEVARTNPHAWSPEPPADPGEVTATNRMASHPYPKLLTANIQVDQAAALVLMSTAAADAAGVPADRRVHLHATATAHDHWFAGNRDDLHRSPALAACGEGAFAHAGYGIDDVALIDLYSCFPVAVQVAAAELGYDVLGDERAPTVTGGLTFAGGPANNYVTHALAAHVHRLREQPDARALSTAVGWYMTKHGVALLGGPGAPPEVPFAHLHPQGDVDALPSRAVAEGAVTAAIEGFTVMFDRDGSPTMGIAAGLTADGDRTFGRTDAGAGLLDGDALGREASFDGAGKVEL